MVPLNLRSTASSAQSTSSHPYPALPWRALASGQSGGWIWYPSTSAQPSDPLNQRLLTYIQPCRGGLWPQDNREAGYGTPQPPLNRLILSINVYSTISSLAVAGFGLRTIGRLDMVTNTHPRPLNHLCPLNHVLLTRFTRPYPALPWRVSTSGQSGGWI
jgi:hypothetical protein